MWFETKGKIAYDPERGRLKKKPDWWAVVNLDPEISRYYRYQVKRDLGVDLHKPSWGTHVSIIRGEKPYPDKMHLWKKYHGIEVNIKYHHVVRYSGDTSHDRPELYWFVNVESPCLIDIRKELNLPCNFGLHMTIGRIW